MKCGCRTTMKGVLSPPGMAASPVFDDSACIVSELVEALDGILGYFNAREVSYIPGLTPLAEFNKAREVLAKVRSLNGKGKK